MIDYLFCANNCAYISQVLSSTSPPGIAHSGKRLYFGSPAFESFKQIAREVSRYAFRKVLCTARPTHIACLAFHDIITERPDIRGDHRQAKALVWITGNDQAITLVPEYDLLECLY
jgi:hypothetical protein